MHSHTFVTCQAKSTVQGFVLFFPFAKAFSLNLKYLIRKHSKNCHGNDTASPFCPQELMLRDWTCDLYKHTNVVFRAVLPKVF